MKILPPSAEVRELIDFKMFTRDLGIVTKGHGLFTPEKTRISGIGSSEVEDLAGDRMLSSALDDMCTFAVGSAIWMNHDYEVPGSIFGSLSVPPQKRLIEPTNEVGAIKAMAPYWAVEVVADAWERNEKAMDTLDAIRSGIRLGYSIGCQITDYDVRKDDQGLPLGILIAHILPLEWSVVGIPCNTQSWVERAVRGLRRKGQLPPKTADWAYLAKNFGDFSDEPLVCVALRQLNDHLRSYGLTLAHLPQEIEA